VKHSIMLACQRTGKIGSTSGGSGDRDDRRGMGERSTPWSINTAEPPGGERAGQGGVKRNNGTGPTHPPRRRRALCSCSFWLLADEGGLNVSTVCSAKLPTHAKCNAGKPAEPRTHLDGLAGLRRSGLSRLGFKLGFHIAGS